MQENPWHPRILPFAVYIIFLPLVQWLEGLDPRTYPFVYSVQCLLVVWLLWRYRQLLPELNIRFHWLAVPIGVGVVVAWILLGWAMAGELGVRCAALADGQWLGRIDYGDDSSEVGMFATTKPHPFIKFKEKHPGFADVSLVLRLLGMSIVVPLFEELFIRSLMLRSLHRWLPTRTGLLQVLQDMPVIGDWIGGTAVGERAANEPPIFGREFSRNPLGALTVFGVCASTFVFMINHMPRDWPGTIACGVAYCWILYATRAKGLGPVCWAHGITNALLWFYTIKTGDWQFL